MDLNLNADGPILPDPLLGDIPPERKLELNQALDAALARRDTANAEKLREQEERLRGEAEERLKLANRDNVSTVIKAHLDGLPEDGSLNLKTRGDLQELRISALSATDPEKDNAWHMTRASEIIRLHQEKRREAGGDGAQDLPDVGHGDAKGGPRGWDLDRLMLSVAECVKDQGKNFDIEKLTGSPEAEMTKDILKHDFASRAYAELTGEAKPHSRIIPIPAAALRSDLRLAETYATAVTAATATRAETYRGDLIVDHFRPMNRLAFLGVLMETISNDQMISRITGAHTASWVAETADAAETSLVVATGTTAPHRLATYDDISWQRLVAADSQFGVMPRVSSEMQRAVNQTKERAVYAGSGASNQPSGLQNVSGVLAAVIGGAAGNTTVTYADILGIITDIADGDIPVEMLRWVTTWAAGNALAQVLTFAASSSLHAVPLYQSIGAGEAGQIGAGFGTIANYPAALTTNLPTDLNSGAETANDEHAIIAGCFPYVTCFDYATAFLTIDDISKAISGQTRITINSYHDVFTRVPPAFSFGEFKPS